MDFLTISSGDSGLYHSQGGVTVLALVAWRGARVSAETKLLYAGPG